MTTKGAKNRNERSCRKKSAETSYLRLVIVVIGILLLLSHPSKILANSLRNDSARVLNEIEVLGVKQMPHAGVLPTTQLSSSTINRLGIQAVKNIGEIVPNLYTPDYGSRMTSSIYMRGLGSRIDQPVVGLNIDGVPCLNKDAYDSDIPFINSIEVLRGAQSVLNGRNAMAGQINIFTLSPRNYQGLKLKAEYGRFNSLNLAAGIFTTLRSNLLTSLTANYGHTDGLWRNVYSNERVGVENNGSVRWKVVFSPSTSHTVTNTMAFSFTRQNGYPYQLVDTETIAYNDPCKYRRNYFSDGITVAWAGKRVVVNSLTSFQYLDDCMTLDQDFTPADYFTLTQSRKEFTFTEDLFAKGIRGKYSWLGGIFGFIRHTDMDAPVTFHNTGIERLIEDKRNAMNPQYPIKWDDRTLRLGSDFTNPARGIALYHQSTYSTSGWTFDAGIRVETEYVASNYRSDADASYTTYHDGKVYSTTPINIHDRGKMSQTLTQVLPRLTVSHPLAGGDVYLSFTKGYKSGGFNSQMFSDVLQQRLMATMGLAMTYSPEEIVKYKPESSWNYEAGVSLATSDNKLGGRATIFIIDCRNQQLTIFPPGTVTGRIMTNAGRTLSKGVEFTGHYYPTEDITLNISYGFTDARFRRYNDGHSDYKGKRVPFAPEHTLWINGRWLTPWRPLGTTTTLDLHMKGLGSIMWNEVNSLKQNFFVLPGASFSLSKEKWSIRVWGENLTSTKYTTFCFTSIGNSFTQRGNPFTFGATVSLNL